jgi:hypothetical protein
MERVARNFPSRTRATIGTARRERMLTSPGADGSYPHLSVVGPLVGNNDVPGNPLQRLR